MRSYEYEACDLVTGNTDGSMTSSQDKVVAVFPGSRVAMQNSVSVSIKLASRRIVIV
jgi:hypothetical protein